MGPLAGLCSHFWSGRVGGSIQYQGGAAGWTPPKGRALGCAPPLLLDLWGLGGLASWGGHRLYPEVGQGPYWALHSGSCPSGGRGWRVCFGGGRGLSSELPGRVGLPTLTHHCTGSLAGLPARTRPQGCCSAGGQGCRLSAAGVGCRLWGCSVSLVVRGLSQCSPVVPGCWHDSLPGWIVSCAPRCPGISSQASWRGEIGGCA